MFSTMELSRNASNLGNEHESDDGIVPVFTVCIVVALVAVVGNIIVLIAICKNKRLRSTTFYLIGQLAFADICVSVTVALTQGLYSYGDGRDCVFLHSLMYGTIFLSGTTMDLIAVERFLAIVYPFRIEDLWTMKHLFWLVAGVWTVAASLMLVLCVFKYSIFLSTCFIEARAMLVTSILLYAFHGAALTILYAIIFHECRKILSHGEGAAIPQGQMSEQMRLAGMFAIITGIYFVCYTPGVVCTSLLPLLNGEVDWKNTISKSTYLALAMLMIINSAANIFVYAVWNESLRHAILMLFRSKTVVQQVVMPFYVNKENQTTRL